VSRRERLSKGRERGEKGKKLEQQREIWGNQCFRGGLLVSKVLLRYQVIIYYF
jgi:hypothetical protein